MENNITGFIYKNKHYTWHEADLVYYDDEVDDSWFEEIPKVAKKDKNEIQTKVINKIQEFCWKYNFKNKVNQNKSSILAKNTDKKYEEWIFYDLDKENFTLIGNTDQMNLWFCETRKDLTPDKLLELTKDLNEILKEYDLSVKISTLVDPEDWQEIANVNDAYEDERYNSKLQEIDSIEEGISFE